MDEFDFASTSSAHSQLPTSSASFQTESTLPNQAMSSRIISDMSDLAETEKMLRQIVRNIVRCDRTLERLDEYRNTCDELKTIYNKATSDVEKLLVETNRSSRVMPAHIFTYPYFRDAQNAIGPNDNQDAVDMQQRWDSLEGANLLAATLRTIWSKQACIALQEAVNKAHLESKLRPIQQMIIKYQRRISDLAGSKTSTGGAMKKYWEKQINNAHELEQVIRDSHTPMTADDEAKNYLIDWRLVAANIGGYFTPRSCQLKWNNCVAPWLNRDTWTKKERQQLLRFVLEEKVENHGRVNWRRVAYKLGTKRSAWVVLKKFMSHLNPNMTAPNEGWTPAEDALLRHWVTYYTMKSTGKPNWNAVASRMTNRRRDQCASHWHRTQAIAVKVKRSGLWTKDEDELLRKAVAVYGERNWAAVARLVPGRTDVQVREHWMKTLRGGYIRTPWYADEDERLLIGAKKCGEGRWMQIHREYIPYRPPDDIKNRFHSLMNTQAKRMELVEQLAQAYDIHISDVPFDPCGQKQFNVAEVERQLDFIAPLPSSKLNPDHPLRKKRDQILNNLLNTTIEFRRPPNYPWLTEDARAEFCDFVPSIPAEYYIDNEVDRKGDFLIASSSNVQPDMLATSSRAPKQDTTNDVSLHSKVKSKTGGQKSTIERTNDADAKQERLITAMRALKNVKRKQEPPKVSAEELRRKRAKTAKMVKQTFDAGKPLPPSVATVSVAQGLLNNVGQNEDIAVDSNLVEQMITTEQGKTFYRSMRSMLVAPLSMIASSSNNANDGGGAAQSRRRR